MSTLQASRDKNAGLALALLAMAESTGDVLRADLARAGLRACGYPGGEGASSVADAMAAIEAAE